MAAGYQSKFTGKQIDKAIGRIPTEDPTVDSLIVVNASGTSVYKPIISLGSQNIKDGSGTSAINQVQDGTTGTFDFTGKNPNATAIDSTLTGQIAYGGTGAFSASFGGKSQASGKRSFAAGTTTVAKGAYSAAFGDNSVALGTDSFAEGIKTTAAGVGSHSEGSDTIARGWGSHVEGYIANANGDVSHAEGCRTESNGIYSHTEGYASKTITTLPASSGGGDAGSGTTPVEPDNWNDDDNLGAMSHAEGGGNLTYGVASHAEGKGNIAYGHRSHAEGRDNTAGEILNNRVTGEAAHVEGRSNVASGNYSHAQGFNTKATGENSFSAGQYTLASGKSATALGSNTEASGENSLAIGSMSKAIALSSFAAGDHVNTNHDYSSALGQGLTTGVNCQTVVGLNNKVSSNSYFVVGNGTSGTESNKRNAFEVLIDGRAKVQTAPKDNDDAVRKLELDTKQAALVSGTNIKTINNQSILGSGNISISGGPTIAQTTGTSTTSVMSQSAVTTELGKKITAPNGWNGSGYGADSVLTRFDADGQTGMLFIRTKLNSDGAGDGIIGYDGTGHCEVSTPIKELQAANKKYVDDAIAAIPGGTTVTANASGTASAVLTSLQVGSSIYSIPQTPTDYVKKYTSTDNLKRVYGININKVETTFIVGSSDNQSSVGTIPCYLSSIYGSNEPTGYLVCHTPTKSYQTANKKYVDEAVVANPTGNGTTALTKLQVGSTIYSISAGSSYTLPTAASSTLGGIKTGYSSSGSSFGVRTDNDGNAYVTIAMPSIVQTTGSSTTAIMSQNATTTAIETAITDAITSVLSTAV